MAVSESLVKALLVVALSDLRRSSLDQWAKQSMGIAKQCSIFFLHYVMLAFNCSLKYVWSMRWKITWGWIAVKNTDAVFPGEIKQAKFLLRPAEIYGRSWRPFIYLIAMCYAIELDLHQIIAPTPQTGALGGPPQMSQMTQQWAPAMHCIKLMNRAECQ